MYHAVEDEPHPRPYKHIHVTRSEFEWQMRNLKKRGYQPITFGTLLAAQAGEAALPPKPVILTFDDGYEDLLKNAVPVLTECAFPYTVFLVSGLIGKDNAWVVPEGLTPFPLLSWSQIREIDATGLASFQPHTISHPHLAEIPIADATKEMAVSRDALQQELGRAMDVFCYPYGSVNAAVAAAAREIGYKCAVTTQFGRVRMADDPFMLPRVSVYHIPPFSLDYGPAGLNYWWRIETRKDKRPAA
jgi:peptidoglycan/xylan/chitin deacetylase (PgdA/CDA1 family)